MNYVPIIVSDAFMSLWKTVFMIVLRRVSAIQMRRVASTIFFVKRFISQLKTTSVTDFAFQKSN